jgi:hypothetical protein
MRLRRNKHLAYYRRVQVAVAQSTSFRIVRRKAEAERCRVDARQRKRSHANADYPLGPAARRTQQHRPHSHEDRVMQEHHRFIGLLFVRVFEQGLKRAVLLSNGIDKQMPDVEVNLRWPWRYLQSPREGGTVGHVEVGVANQRHEAGTGSFNEVLEGGTRQEGDVVATADQIRGDGLKRGDMSVDRGGGDDDACHCEFLGLFC